MELTEAVQSFLVERLLTWQVTLSASQSYFKELADVERQREKGYRRAASILAPKNIHRSDLLGSLTHLSGSLSGSSRSPSPTGNSEPPDRGNAWLVPLQAAALKADNEAAGLLAYLEGQVMTRLQDCKAFFKEHRDVIKSRLEGACRELNESKDRLSACNDAAVDPWLAQVQRSTRQQQYQRQLSLHHTTLQSLFTDIYSLDRELTSRLTNIISEYFIVAAKTAAVFAEQLNDMSSIMSAMDGQSEWSMAMMKAGIDENWRLTSNIVLSPRLAQLEKSVFDSIAKSGFLMKQSGGFGRAWSIYFVVLSGGGHLHGYRCASFPEDPNLRIPSASMHLHKRALSDVNEHFLSILFSDHSDWLGEPTFSVNLSSPVVTVKPEPSAVSVSVVSQGGFFGKSEKKYVFKSWVEEDIQEWAAFLMHNYATIDQQTANEHQQTTVQEPYYQQTVQQQYYQHEDEQLSESSSQHPQSSSYSAIPPMENPWND